MITAMKDNTSVYLRYDPTHTTALRNAFARDMKRRFRELINVIRDTIVLKDCFGLRKNPILDFQLTPTDKEAFSFMRDPAKIEAFMRWLDKQVERGILQMGEFQQVGTAMEGSWLNKYILDSYKRGIMRARMEMIRSGRNIPSIEESGGIDAIMGMPMHIDRAGLLFTRAFSDLQGITSSMDSIISRILSQGMIDGDGAALLARKIIAAIDGENAGELGLYDKLGRFIPAMQRATMIARTEIIRAHHLATMQEYRNWAQEGVFVRAEWMTAGDDRVCDECAKMEGKVFTLDEAESLIPKHPHCRCIILPWSEELIKYVP
jgi:SPP1 gp7 family putative phage head morphogenesis protein